MLESIETASFMLVFSRTLDESETLILGQSVEKEGGKKASN